MHRGCDPELWFPRAVRGVGGIVQEEKFAGGVRG